MAIDDVLLPFVALSRVNIFLLRHQHVLYNFGALIYKMLFMCITILFEIMIETFLLWIQFLLNSPLLLVRVLRQ